jgi:hypothetical protein
MSYRGRRSFLKKHLRINLELELTNQNKDLFKKFVDEYLGGDGILFLRLIAKNTNPVIAGKKKKGIDERHEFNFYVLGELLGIMWEQFVDFETKLKIITTKEKDVDTYLNGGVISTIKED